MELAENADETTAQNVNLKGYVSPQVLHVAS